MGFTLLLQLYEHASAPADPFQVVCLELERAGNQTLRCAGKRFHQPLVPGFLDALPIQELELETQFKGLFGVAVFHRETVKGRDDDSFIVTLAVALQVPLEILYDDGIPLL